MAWENWPMTNWHEINLDWLIKTVKELSEKVTDDYKAIYKTIADGDKKTLDSANSQSKRYTDGEIDKLENNLLIIIKDDIGRLNKAIMELYSYVDMNDYENRRYIDYQILKMYDDLHTLIKDKELKVYNPCRGTLDNTAKCVNDLYTYLAIHGPSALDSEYFTVNDVETALLKVRDFDLYSKNILIKILNETHMFSAYDGKIKTLWNEIGLNTLNCVSKSPGATYFEGVLVSNVDNLNVKDFDFNYLTN